MSSSCFLSPSLARARTRFIVYRSMRIAAAAAVSQHTAGGWPSLNCSLFSNTTNVDKWIFRIFLFFYIYSRSSFIYNNMLYTFVHLSPSPVVLHHSPAMVASYACRRSRRTRWVCTAAAAAEEMRRSTCHFLYTHTHRRYTRNIISANQLPGILSYDAYIPIRRGTVVVLRV